MDADTVEIECPVCDRKVRADAPRCPYCGAEYAMSGVDELEQVARELNCRTAPVVPRPSERPAEVPAAAAVVEQEGEDDAGKGFFGKLFRKRR